MLRRFTAAIVQEGKWYVATCLELGVVSQGRTTATAKKNLEEAVALYLEDEPERTKKPWPRARIAPLRVYEKSAPGLRP